MGRGSLPGRAVPGPVSAVPAVSHRGGRLVSRGAGGRDSQPLGPVPGGGRPLVHGKRPCPGQHPGLHRRKPASDPGADARRLYPGPDRSAGPDRPPGGLAGAAAVRRRPAGAAPAYVLSDLPLGRRLFQLRPSGGDAAGLPAHPPACFRGPAPGGAPYPGRAAVSPRLWTAALH